MSHLLEVTNLKIGFQTDHGLLTAVDDVDFVLDAGKTLGIVGESGCGKSVTALSLMRLLPQPAGRILGGSVLLDGQELTSLPIEQMRKVRGNDIAMIFQEPMTALNPVHRIGRQIIEAIQLHEPTTPDKALRRAVELMEWVGIPAPDQRVNEFPHQLSGGMRQRVMIAMALSCHPKVLIADEPTTALDVTVQAQILDLIKRLQKETGMAVILITHDLGVVAETCDDVAVMYAGRIAERGPVDAIFKSPLHPYTQGLMNCLPKLDHPSKTALPVIPGMVPTLRDMPSGCRFASRCPNPHDDSVLTTRQPWQECSGGHGVEACACFASGLALSSDSSYTSDHEQQSPTDPSASLKAALSELSRDETANAAQQSDSGREVRRGDELRRLVQYAKAVGRLIATSRFGTPDDSGAEHRVYADERQRKVFKVTNPNRSGMTFVNGEPAAALPSEYLLRWIHHNELFGDDVQFEGIVENPSGISLVVSQQWVTGAPPTAEQIADHMTELGFTRVGEGDDYYRAADQIAVLDCHELNFILGIDGEVYAIDVIPITADTAVKTALEVPA